jgi:hypothetical protein
MVRGTFRSWFRTLVLTWMGLGLFSAAPSFAGPEFKADIIQLHAVVGSAFNVGLNQLLKKPLTNVNWAFEQSKPAWLTITPRALAGTPQSTDEGIHVFRLYARDANSNSNVVTRIELTVEQNENANLIDLGTGEEGAYFQYDFNPMVQKFTGHSVFSSSDSPGWLSLTSDGLLSGMPSGNDAGTFTFTLIYSNGGHRSTTTVMGAVKKHVDSPRWIGNPLVGNDAQSNFAYTLDISGAATTGISKNITFSLETGPAWISLSPAGILNGVPGFHDAGPTSVTVKVSGKIDGEIFEDTAVIQFTVW